MILGAPDEITNFNSSYLVGKGMLLFRRSGKVAEGWWNGQIDMIYGRYMSESINTSFVGHMAREYF